VEAGTGEAAGAAWSGTIDPFEPHGQATRLSADGTDLAMVGVDSSSRDQIERASSHARHAAHTRSATGSAKLLVLDEGSSTVASAP